MFCPWSYFADTALVLLRVHVDTLSAMCFCYSYREGCRFVASKVLEDINVQETILPFAAGNVDNIITGYLAPYQCTLRERCKVYNINWWFMFATVTGCDTTLKFFGVECGRRKHSKFLSKMIEHYCWKAFIHSGATIDSLRKNAMAVQFDQTG